MLDKYKATWVSHSSISDFLTCPRLYYLRHVYKDPKTGNKITVMKPPLALGQVVHDVIESLSVLPVEERFLVSPLKKLEVAWQQISGKKGGFSSLREEAEYQKRGQEMLKRLTENPGPLQNKAIKIPGDLPWYWLSEEEKIILSGKIDWLEYLEGDDSVHVIDFKTGKKGEGENESLQLPIYKLLVTHTQKRPVTKASFWYLEHDDQPQLQNLPEIKEAFEQVFKVAKRIKLARQINHFKCPKKGCFACKDLESVIQGEGEKVGISQYRQDIYIL